MFGVELLDPGSMAHRRSLKQPGPSSPRRVFPQVAPTADQLSVWLAPGVMFDAVVDSMATNGFNHAGLQIFDGDLAVAFYQVAPPDPTGEKVVAYGPPIPLPGGARIVMASITLGRTVDGKPILHCHGVLRDRQGKLYGGHIPTDLCVIGAEGVSAWAGVSKDAGFIVRPDTETGFSLLVPCEGNA